VFSPSPSDGVLHQGEVVTDVIQVQVRAASLALGGGDLDLEEKVHPYALILTQDCDLDWDYKARAPALRDVDENKRESKLVPNVLLCELATTDIVRPRLAGSDILKRVRNNQDERYHCLPAIQPVEDRAGAGLPELIADFKRIFSIPTEELYLRLGLGVRRRAVMDSPFLQHLSARFGYYCLRVALPEMSQPVLTAEVAPIARPLPGATESGGGIR